jgi:RNA 2',3'-cyclic 3'-phosphodiesterase
MQTSTQQNIRCFIAIEIPKTVQEKLIAIQNELRKQIEFGRASWVKPGNVHLTLKFLGDVPKNRIEAVNQALKNVASNHPPFSMQIRGIGAFPNMARPRVIWSSVKSGAKEAAELARDINIELSRCGFPLDNKKFNPHLTLARLKSRINLKPFVEIFRQYDEIDGATFPVNEIKLIKSQLHPGGSIYTTLQSSALNQKSVA